MPGPESLATTTSPQRRSPISGRMATFPLPAWTRMLRAISEIAVAMSVASVREKPSLVASARPCARASMMCSSESIGTCTASSTVMRVLHQSVEHLETLLEVQGRVHGLEVELELHHRHRNVGLDSDDHGLSAAQPCGQRDRLQRPCNERV